MAVPPHRARPSGDTDRRPGHRRPAAHDRLVADRVRRPQAPCGRGASQRRWRAARGVSGAVDRAEAGGRRLAEDGAAAAAAADAVGGGFHAVGAHRALGRPGGVQALPYAVEPLLEREPAAVGAVGPLAAEPLGVEALSSLALGTERKRRALSDERELPAAAAGRQRTHETLLQTPTTFPSTAASRVRIGSMAEFSGWSLM